MWVGPRSFMQWFGGAHVFCDAATLSQWPWRTHTSERKGTVTVIPWQILHDSRDRCKGPASENLESSRRVKQGHSGSWWVQEKYCKPGEGKALRMRQSCPEHPCLCTIQVWGLDVCLQFWSQSTSRSLHHTWRPRLGCVSACGSEG